MGSTRDISGAAVSFDFYYCIIRLFSENSSFLSMKKIALPFSYLLFIRLLLLTDLIGSHLKGNIADQTACLIKTASGIGFELSFGTERPRRSHN